MEDKILKRIISLLLALLMLVTLVGGAAVAHLPEAPELVADYVGPDAEAVASDYIELDEFDVDAARALQLPYPSVLVFPRFLTQDAAENLCVYIRPGTPAWNATEAVLTAAAGRLPPIPELDGAVLVEAPGWYTLFHRGTDVATRNQFYRVKTAFYVPANLFVDGEVTSMYVTIENNRRAPSFQGVQPLTAIRHQYERPGTTEIIRLPAISDRLTRGGNWTSAPAQFDADGNRLPGQTWALGSALAPFDPNNFNTPMFRNQIFDEDGMLIGLVEDRPLYQWTTRTEWRAFMNELNTGQPNSDYMHVFNVGYSPHNFAHIADPRALFNDVMIFTTTDLSAANCWTEAGALVQANDKPTMFLYTGVHGHEVSATEGALAVSYALMTTEWGAEVLQTVNIVFYLNVNGSGTHQQERRTSTVPGVQHHQDGNRDFMLQHTQEIRQLHQVWLAFMPELTLDGHEIGGVGGFSMNNADDHQLQLHGGPEVDDRIAFLGAEILQRNFDDGKDAGVRIQYYTVIIVNASVGSYFYSLHGGISIIFETRGQSAQIMLRRAYSTYVSLRSMIEFMVEHSDRIVETVAEVRADLAEAGRTYDPDPTLPNPLRLLRDHTGAAGIPDPRMPIITRWHVQQGGGYTVATTTHFVGSFTNTETRSMPTGYIVPMEIDWVPHSNNADNPRTYAQAVASLRTMLANHGIEYYIVAAGLTLPNLQQFYVSSTQVVPRDNNFRTQLRPAADVSFDVPVLFIPMDQPFVHVIGNIMEPDMRVAMREGANVSLSWAQTLQTSGRTPAGTPNTPLLDDSRTLLHCPDTRNMPIFRFTEDDPRDFVPVAISITNAPAMLRRNASVALGATIVPATAQQEVVWTSSNPALATVSQDGVVTARVATGIVVITARTADGQAVASVTIRLSM